MPCMISMPLPQKVSTNAIYSGMHWSKRKRIADTYHRALLPHRTKRFLLPAHLLFTFTFKGKLLDCSNCSMMTKMLEDGMVQYKILPDDTPQYVPAITIRVLKGKADTVSIDDLVAKL